MISRLHEMPRFIFEHRWTQGHMSNWIDGELPDADRRRIDEHVRRCPECRRLLESLKRVVLALGELGGSASISVADGVIARLRAER